MRTHVFLILIGLTVLFSTEVLLGKKEEAPMKLSVRQQVDSEIHNLKRNLEKSKKMADQWKALEKSEKEIQMMRARSPRQFEKDEIYLDILAASLAEIPRHANFKKDQCESYRTSILAHYDPQGDEKPVAPVAQTFEILKILCH